jgi:hypothetical protein
VGGLTDKLLVGGVLLCAGALLLLAWLVHRHAVASALREGEAARLREEALRMELLDRRRAVCARLDALWLCWARCERPGEALLADAAAAAEEARLLFPAELGPDLDEVSALLVAAVRHRGWGRAAVEQGRHGERVVLLEQEAELERALKPKVAGLRTLLAEASRPAGAA